jgi:hypothetical protein
VYQVEFGGEVRYAEYNPSSVESDGNFSIVKYVNLGDADNPEIFQKL